jgi:hypothetical protein
MRILFATEPDAEAQVRQLIDLAPGQLKFPDGFTTPWRLSVQTGQPRSQQKRQSLPGA